ncbi:hypothetical protein [Desulfonatronum thioautotrophicum]|uniref:hypothetical protein n=1 Tax=Desulfonatronum thioautotrophicum TaxID=617001 RepID=UPI0005EB1AFF|nr:hypothetical protein [Desulfonatronum thioautotrophicum]
MAEESTEKLLRIIREADRNRVRTGIPAYAGGTDASGSQKAGAGGSVFATTGPADLKPPVAPSRRSASRLPRLPGLTGRGRRLGVDISPARLHLVLTTDGSAPRLLGTRESAYPPGMSPEAPNFPAFLHQEVQALCGRTSDLRVWAHFFSTRAQLQHILVPKVPAWELYDIVFWRVKKDNPFDENEFLLDFEVQGQLADKGVARLNVLCCLVPRRELAEARAVFGDAGLPLAGMTLASLAFQRLFRGPMMPVQATSFATLHVGRNWSRIDIFSGNNLYLSRVVKTGLYSMAESLVQHCNEQLEHTIATQPDSAPQPDSASRRDPADLADLAMPELEVHLDVEPDSRPAVASAGPSGEAPAEHGAADTDPVPDKNEIPATETPQRPAPADTTRSPINLDQGLNTLVCTLAQTSDQNPLPGLSDAAIIDLIRPVCERLSRQVERTIDFNVREQHQERAEVLLLSGDLAVNQRVRQYFHDSLGLQTLVLDPLDPERHPIWADRAPATDLGRVRLNLALALAMCDDKQGLNLLRPQRQQEQARSESRVNLVVYAATILMLLVCGTFYHLQGHALETKTRELDRLDQELATFVPALSGDILLSEAARFRDSQADLRQLSARLEVLALLRDVLGRTPDHVRLFNVRIDSGEGSRPAPGARAARSDSRRALVMDGMITGDPMGFETALAGYIMALQRSPLLETPQVHDKRQETGPLGEERLRFVLQAIVTGKDVQASLGPAGFPHVFVGIEINAHGGGRLLAGEFPPRTAWEPAS